MDIPALDILLPVGISFFTFQTMSYTIDVYRGVLQPTRTLVNFLAYVSFFPQLVAGPIERAAHLLPQFARTVTISRGMLREGIWLSIWGMFKKVVIADNLAPLVEMTYSHPQPGALLLVLGTFAFALQIYCDFSGYSDIARGVAKILGIDIMINFNVPYLASNIREFWQRWHISLSTWLRDYLYIPLGGNRGSQWFTFRNLMITMLLGGLWHGASWTFVLWGFLHGAGLIAHRIWSWYVPAPADERSPLRVLRGIAGWAVTFVFVCYCWVFFRAQDMTAALHLIRRMTIPTGGVTDIPPYFWVLVSVTVLGHIIGATGLVKLDGEKRSPLWLPAHTLAYAAVVYLCLLFAPTDAQPFIYFQF